MRKALLSFVLTLTGILSAVLFAIPLYAAATYSLEPVTIAGSSAVLTVDISGGDPSTNYFIEGGTLQTSGDCLLDPAYVSNGQQVSASSNKISYTMPGLVAGTTYCSAVASKANTVTTVLTVLAKFTGPSETFTITPYVTTTTPTATSSSGCVAGDGGYCLLAPLPGIGDSTGRVDVSTGFGPYAKSIIRLIIGLIGVLSVLMIVVGGIEYMTTVQVGEKASSKNRIVNALFGLLLAVSSYIILNTINPNLVNLNITVPSATLTLESDESDESDYTPTSLPAVSGITIPSGTAQDLAKKILQTTSISFTVLKDEARSTPKQNITDTSNGQSAWTSIRGHAGASPVALNSKMLAALLAIGQQYPATVTEIAGGRHSGPSSKHYKGAAFDISASANNPTTNKAILDICRAAGAVEKIGPCNTYSTKVCSQTGYTTNVDHSTHIHCGW